MFSASFLDSENELTPLAFAIMDQEDLNNWYWFLDQLELAMATCNTRLTNVLDHQKDLVPALERTILLAGKTACVWHIAQNVKENFRSHSSVNFLFWKAARTYRDMTIDHYMAKIKDIDEKAYDYLVKRNPLVWANCLVEGKRYCIITSNTAECFNAWIDENERKYPVLFLVQYSVSKVAEKFYNCHHYAQSGSLPSAAKTRGVKRDWTSSGSLRLVFKSLVYLVSLMFILTRESVTVDTGWEPVIRATMRALHCSL